jgi:hypothetical protein
LFLSFSQPSSFEQSTADARKQLFEELLWEHRDLAEAHSHCQGLFLSPPASFYRNVSFFDTYTLFCLTVVPEATIEALKAQVAKLQGTILSSSANLFLFSFHLLLLAKSFLSGT